MTDQVGGLHLLGEWRLRLAGRPAPPCSPTGQRLLALLALAGRRSRAEVVDALWPGSPAGGACGCLRTTLWRLHPDVHGLIMQDHGHLELHPRLFVDVTDFYRATSRVLEGKGMRIDPERLDVDLLPGWYRDDWVIFERERVRQSALGALDALALHLTANGRTTEAVAAALRSIRKDPLRESAHRAVICAHLVDGNLAEARRHYEVCRAVFRQELGVEPGQDLLRLVHGPGGFAVRSGSPAAGAGLAEQPVPGLQ